MRNGTKVFCWTLCALVVLLLPAAVQARGATPHVEVFVLGDSLSDPGNLYDLTGFFPPEPNARRNCDGPVWTEYFEEATGVTVDSRAYGGALSGVFPVDFGAYRLSFSNFNNVQYPQLFDPVAYPLPGVAEELDDLLAEYPEGLNPHALYVLWAGANDFFLGLTLQEQMQDPTALGNILDGTARHLEDTVCRLASAGARHFAVGNLPDIGLTPYARNLGEATALSFSAVIGQFNAQLEERLARLVWPRWGRLHDHDEHAGTPGRSHQPCIRNDHEGAEPSSRGGSCPPPCRARVRSLVILDTYRYLQEAVADPASIGLADATTPCLLLGPGVDCSEYLFWDPVHLTTAGQQVFSERILEAFCGTGQRGPDVGRWRGHMPPLAWWGVCYGSR